MANKPAAVGAHVDVTFRFANHGAAHLFLSWMCEMGEQDYWNWMHVREAESNEADITAVSFDYDFERGIATAECGRLDEYDT